MALDPYRFCPCGSGKKMKFCCSKDILSELDKVIRAIEGEQRAAALDQIAKLIDVKGPRPALLSLKADVQLSLSTLDEAEATIEELSKISPHNPSTTAMRALLEAGRGDVEEAVDTLQRALEYVEEEMPSVVYSAIGEIGKCLIQKGDFLGGRGHCLLQLALSGGKDRGPMSLLLQLDRLEELSPLVKEDFSLAPPPADVPWIGEFNAALASASRGAWRAACESLASLSEKTPRQPAIVRNIAILRGWLGEERKACQAWREYASLDSVPLDDAVAAEALAQHLDEGNQDMVASVRVTYPVRDTDRLMERLLSDRRLVRVPGESLDWKEEGQPPPRCAFLMLDRAACENGQDLLWENTPRVAGIAALFGKETDREARLDVTLDSAANIEGDKRLIAELAGEWVGEPGAEVAGRESPLVAQLFAPQWFAPENTPPEKRRELNLAFQRDALLRRWPETPLAVLGGKCPREAAQDAGCRVRVLAALALLELELEDEFSQADFGELRSQLGLPPMEPLDPANLDVVTLSLSRLRRLDISKLTDDQLLPAAQRSVLKGMRRTTYSLTAEMLSRPSLQKRINAETLCEIAMKTAPDSNAALHWALEGRRRAEAEHRSPAHWLIAELSIRIPRGDAAEADQLFSTLRSRHLKEPGVADALKEVLTSFGLLRPDEDGEPREAAPPPEPKKIWTPDTASTPAPTSGASKLWVPGMD